MKNRDAVKIFIVYQDDPATRHNPVPKNRGLEKVFEAFAGKDILAVPVVYHDDFYSEIREQLLNADAVLVWVNPIVDGRDRTKLNSLLGELSQKGIFVSTHPDIIQKLGTKEVLYRTREVGWGSDVYLYSTIDDMKRQIPERLALGEIRVIKQNRGQSGEGVWRVERESGSSPFGLESQVRVQHAKSGSAPEVMTLTNFFDLCEPYFKAESGHGCVIDQAYETRIAEGMIRCYLVHDKVAGFGRQEIVALYPNQPDGTPAPQVTKRHYHDASKAEFQKLKQLVEDKWVPAAQKILGIETKRLPVLWDCDFMFGKRDSSDQDTFVLCEINVSCVSPFPESAAEPLVDAVLNQLNLI